MPKKDEMNFFEQVFEVVKLIPPGKVTSYGAIAKYLGMAKSSRMVGWAMNQSHFLKDKIPAHRVVNRNGMLTGKAHFENHEQMKFLLEKEGLLIKNDTIMNFEKHFWNPADELKL
ncbi:MAG: MGMT family protein [Bacteroidetes bacterium]|nr:MGMT family protein [Bacteroidota bacterium]